MEYYAIVATSKKDVEHYGRIGMHWYQHVFGKADARAAYARKGLNVLKRRTDRVDQQEQDYLNDRPRQERLINRADRRESRAQTRLARAENRAARAERHTDRANRRLERANNRYLRTGSARDHDRAARAADRATRAATRERRANTRRDRAQANYDRASSTAKQLKSDLERGRLNLENRRRALNNLAGQIRDLCGDLDINTLSATQIETARRYSLNIVGDPDDRKKSLFVSEYLTLKQGSATAPDPGIEEDVNYLRKRGLMKD